MYPVFRSLLFKLPPETAHHLTLRLVRLAGLLPPTRALLEWMFSTPPRPVRAFGLTFPNPVGLAAGYDKDGVAVQGLSALGFGHLELGTVTPRPQPGNPPPRVFRLVEEAGVINRMGFPGRGMQYVRQQLSVFAERFPKTAGQSAGSGRGPRGVVLGVNLGKNKDTPLEQAADDYIALMRAFAPLADYLAINISSPNTVGLRRLQGRELLEGLLRQIRLERSRLRVCPPVLVKIAPDLSDEELDDAVGAILENDMDGIIATNTTLSREGVRSPLRAEAGGLSGRPLTALADSVLQKTAARVQGRVPLVAAGGIMTPDDARRKLDLGATLVQVYTGLVYAGPGLVKAIVRTI
ncbi:MAG: quinone-dependent dihydroorotate dehydrogenase [Anaerolineales bacterium]|nr:quinone-dependent dihydroorotate dehydrogenase [Anaerolineales bacterium]MDW8277435.1 quinone-dependent dihydroorotate dehydrogenase [Anaerolineales bacterium]